MGENGLVSLTVEGEHRLKEDLEQRKADFENAQRDFENASDDSDIRAADEKKRRIKSQMDEIERTLSHCTIIESRSELEKRLEELKFTERPKASQERMHSLDSLKKSAKEKEALAVNGHEDEIRKLEERLAGCATVEDRSVLEKKMNDLVNEKNEAVTELNSLKKRSLEIDDEKTGIENKLEHGITEKEKADYEQRLSQLKNEKAEIKAKKEKAADVRTAKKDENDKVVAKEKDLESRIKPIQDKFDRGLNFFDRLRRSSLEKELDELTAELRETVGEEIKLSAEIKDASAECKDATEKLNGINKEIQTIQKNLTDVIVIKDRDELSKRLSQLKNEKPMVAEKQEKARRRKTNAEAQIKEIGKRIEKAMTAEEKSECEKRLHELKEEKKKDDEDFKSVENRYKAAKNDYDAAEERLDEIDKEINEINYRLSQMGADDGEIRLGSSVTYENLESGKERTVRIVSATEADSTKGCISDDSPLGTALLGHKAGETVDVKSGKNGSYEARILSVDSAE